MGTETKDNRSGIDIISPKNASPSKKKEDMSEAGTEKTKSTTKTGRSKASGKAGSERSKDTRQRYRERFEVEKSVT